MSTINVTMLRALRDDIEAALKGIGERHGVALNLGKCSYTQESATFKLEASVVDTKTGVAKTKEHQNLLMAIRMGRLPESALNGTVRSGRDEYTIIGHNTGSKCILRREADGKRFLMDESIVSGLLGLEDINAKSKSKSKTSATKSKPLTFTRGQTVMALFDDDGEYYEAEIASIKGDYATVVFTEDGLRARVLLTTLKTA